jgi:hypothetical protein
MSVADPVVDHDGGQGDAAEAGQGVLVIAGGDSAPLLDAVETAFDGVAVAVELRIECRSADTCGPLALVVRDLVAAFGDSVLDLQRAQLFSGAVVRVGLVCQQALVPGLVSGEQRRDWGVQLVGQGVDLGGPHAVRAAPGRGRPVRRHILVIWSCSWVVVEAGAGEVLMRKDAGGVHRDQPRSSFRDWSGALARTAANNLPYVPSVGQR